MKHILTIILCMILSGAFAQSNDNYFIKADFSGSFLKVFGEVLSNTEITTFNVERWAVPGIEIGKIIHPKFHISLSFTPSFRIYIEEQWSLGNGLLDGDLSLDYKTPLILSINSRYYPFKKGFYGGISVQSLSSASYEMRLSPRESSLQIGVGDYISSAEGSWEYKSAITPSFSLGCTVSFAKRLLADIGLQVPIISAPFHNDIKLALTNGQAIEPNDQLFGEQRIEEETFYYPIQLRIQLGYRFCLLSN